MVYFDLRKLLTPQEINKKSKYLGAKFADEVAFVAHEEKWRFWHSLNRSRHTVLVCDYQYRIRTTANTVHAKNDEGADNKLS